MHESTARGLRYAGWSSMLFGLLCLGLGANELLGGLALGPLRLPRRWDPSVVTFPLALRIESIFLILYAGLLFLPWSRISEPRTWNRLFAVLCAASVLFAFAMISEVMAKNYIAQGAGMKARLPVFQAVLLFLSLGQIPIRLFIRRPSLLD